MDVFMGYHPAGGDKSVCRRKIIQASVHERDRHHLPALVFLELLPDGCPLATRRGRIPRNTVGKPVTAFTPEVIYAPE
jgi:hypothetical protein